MQLPKSGPEIAYITLGNAAKTAEGVNLLWLYLTGLIQVEAQDYNLLRTTLNPKVLTSGPTSTQTDFDSQGSAVLQFTGASNWALTGVRSGLTGLLLIINTGSGTLTIKHQATSAAGNQFSFAAGSDKSVSTGKSVLCVYLAPYWTEVSLA